jgi:hypothetical protein
VGSVVDEAEQWPNRLDRVNHRSIKSINSFASQTSSLFVAPMDTQQPRRRIPTIQFRVLIIGRANAGKTSILQRVCDTTESPVVYRGDEEVRGPTFLSASLISLPTRLNLTRQWMLVTMVFSLIDPKHRTSEANTASTTSLCSPITRVMFFTILVESSRVAQRNSEFCRNSFDASVEKGDCDTDCMQYGLNS